MVKNNKIRQTCFKKFLMWLKSTDKQATAIPPNQGVQQRGKTEEGPLVSARQPFSPHHTHTKYYLHEKRPQATVLRPSEVLPWEPPAGVAVWEGNGWAKLTSLTSFWPLTFYYVAYFKRSTHTWLGVTHSIGQDRYRTFPSPQKVVLNRAAISNCTHNSKILTW